MASRVHHSRGLLGSFFPLMPRDYLLRRRRMRNISNVVLIVLLSILVAGVIIYTSNPAGFGGSR